jgi:predicted nucleotidyltransferase
VILAYLHGSAAAGRMTPLSDVVIALVLDEEALPGFPRLQFELMAADEIEQECGVNQADVRIINDAPLMLRGRAVTDGILLFVRDQSKRIAFKTRTRRVDAAQPQAVRQPSK